MRRCKFRIGNKKPKSVRKGGFRLPERRMDTWSFTKIGYDPAAAVADGNRFLLANGYMGLRGTPEEAGRDELPALNLAGVYDQNGDRWREPVNAPRALVAMLTLDGRPMALGKAEPASHTLSIDYRRGVLHRETDFGAVRLQSERIVSLAEPHLLCAQMQFTFAEDGEAELCAGISTDIWDINGPHLTDIICDGGRILRCAAITGEKKIPIAVAQSAEADFFAHAYNKIHADGIFRVLRFRAERDRTYTVRYYAAVYTGLDGEQPEQSASALCFAASEKGYDECLAAHTDAWERVWQRSAITLEGDDEAALALHASQYYLNSIAPRHAKDLSIPARGLSGQTYKGAIFWDSEIFLFPMFVHTQPEVAASLLRYRIETLPGARKKAAEYGYRGAFYAWESQEGGAEGCTNFNVVDVFTHRPVRTYFRDKQIHISGDVAYALWEYYRITGDRTLLENGGAEVILECARFYLSRAGAHIDCDTVDFADVIGPDEYHERVTNNAFTNAMAKFCMENALRLQTVFSDRTAWFDALLDRLDFRRDYALLRTVAPRIRAPRIQNGVIEQFDGYFDLEDVPLDTVRARLCDPREYWGGDHGVAGPTQIIKQADVIALQTLFPKDFSDEQVAESWRYYEPRTEHGSSLSACMYALAACRIGKPEKAWDYFVKTASIDLVGGGKQWAGEIYIGGTHPAANGGAWMIAVLGFAGLSLQNGRIELHPHLPKQITRLSFPITAKDKRYTVTVTQNGWTVAEQKKEPLCFERHPTCWD